MKLNIEPLNKNDLKLIDGVNVNIESILDESEGSYSDENSIIFDYLGINLIISYTIDISGVYVCYERGDYYNPPSYGWENVDVEISNIEATFDEYDVEMNSDISNFLKDLIKLNYN